jgi:hypothetical protein
MIRKAVISAFFLGLGASAAQAAGGPYVVDDSVILGAGECHVESWYSHAGSGDDLIAVAPACNIADVVEITLRGDFLRVGGTRSEVITLQGKSELFRIGQSAFGLAVVGGLAYGTDSNDIDEVYAFAPLSLPVHEDVLVNLNGGWAWDRAARQHMATWGAQVAYTVTPNFEVIGEVFGASRGQGGFQVGVRPWLIADRFHLDFVYGRGVLDNRGDTWTAGLVAVF